MATYASMFFFIGIKPDDSKNTTFEGLGKSLENLWLAALSSGYDFIEPWDNNGFLRLSLFCFSIFATS